MSKQIQAYCKQYREKNGVLLRELSINVKLSTLSAFELGKSTNLNHLNIYYALSSELNDTHNFMTGLKEVLDNGNN